MAESSVAEDGEHPTGAPPGDGPEGDDGELGAASRPAFSTEEGDDKERLVGIMYSDRQWIVAPWMKAVFFYCAVMLLGALVAYGVDKRQVMRRLTMDSVVEPTPIDHLKAPDFILPEGDDKTQGVRLKDFEGKWVFVNFWATWCPPCRDEMPSMEMLNRRFGEVAGDAPKGDWTGPRMQMLAITVDEDWNEVNRFFGDTAPSFKVLWDKNKNVATRQYGTRKFPESYLINPQGEVVVRFVGPRDWYNMGTVQYFEDVLTGKRDPST